LAKDPDNLADSFATENTGGLLSGFLAEEDEFDRRALWRLGSWGVGAVGAVTLAVLANQTSIGWRHDQLAAADLTRHAQQIQMVARETQNEARRLAAAIDTLNGDRDRLYTRVTTLEQGLDSVTGAINRQGAAATPLPAPATPSTAAEPQATAPVPAVAPVATTQAGATDKPPIAEKAPAPSVAEASPPNVSSVAKNPIRTESSKTDSKIASPKGDSPKIDSAKVQGPKADGPKVDGPKVDSSMADGVKSDTPGTDLPKIDTAKFDPPKPSDATPATPLVASKSLMAPPDPSASKLTEPGQPPSVITAAPISEVVASAPVADDAEADEATAPTVALQRTEFGVDLGSANSIPGLRALWRGLLKSKSNAPLTALRPIIVLKESNNGLGMQLRLVAGPLNDAGAAAKICAVLVENKRSCATAIFDGQRLSMKADDPPPATTKPAPRRRGMPKHAAVAVAEEPAKKPEPATSTLTSWFGKKSQ
jgi:hypothetical protein